MAKTKAALKKQKSMEESISFFNSGNKAVALFGLLIRDTAINEKDISNMGTSLREKFCLPTTCLK